VKVWGTGAPRRQFLYVDDAVDAGLFRMRLDEERLHDLLNQPVPAVNIGTEGDIAVADLARLIARIVGYGGRLEFDASRPDRAHCKSLDASRLDRLGWRATVSLEEGIRRTDEWCESVAP
jgi:nucleoside-diphosphate-sugar epimerase